ncbi:hypothetical protein A3J44_01185 [candidate division WOR-1 bacterium RIFCSPHIGHO2_02_FULL_45_12]|uniref:FAD dependent oxidoreductase domain-containing protein n=1 Tax=candidate division WOR-1 bacterium RIFCSPLOWO2_12_FULL_45_9 TaxID=1802568 RepID=A0A1F4RNE7_UNCSA|nr:MAG: hypothetical protein A3J44_01185 [candidate division WOR-1 bacterium RIFCSPHIGHO2_02_FULL_45_12]OGC09690.1 MAG: hypothetical protein A3F86_02275 [candidate division WOR-1 bacterium RIFCSPLOWO2_12_FULL_45_9]
MDKTNVVIIGAGVVGLAIAAELSKEKQDIVLLEKESSFGQGSSSRNSEVIHAGIYYPKDSLKAELCVTGSHLLYEYCAQKNVPHKKLGKIIVALDLGEISQLEKLCRMGKDNGVTGLGWMDQRQLAEYEPEVKAVRALYSPQTGIIDSHKLMKVLENQARENGVLIAYGNELRGISKENGGYVLQIKGQETLLAEQVINAAGLFSDRVAAMAGIDLNKQGYQLYFCKGEYFSYTGKPFIKHLVYPVPERDTVGLGVHAVLDLAGNLKFGPSVEYVEDLDYSVSPDHCRAFWESIHTLFPQIKESDLAPDQAGIRPKLQGPGEAVRDFVIREESSLDLPGFINLIGIESPGLTACLAIARRVSRLVC